MTGQVAGTSNYRTLDDLQARLDPDVFWRVHRSHLVNINKIKEIVPWFSRNYILRMKDAKGDGDPGQPVADEAAPGVPEALTLTAAGAAPLVRRSRLLRAEPADDPEPVPCQREAPTRGDCGSSSTTSATASCTG